MRRFSLTTLFLSFAVVSIASCGGGGGSGGGGPGVVQLAVLKATLLGSNETTVVDADARASVIVVLRSDGELRFAATAQAGYVGDITGMHIHRAPAGVDGPIEVDLLSGGAAFDGTTRTASDTLAIAPALADEIANAPDDFYVNIHTSFALPGLVREQLAPFAGLEVHAVALGSNVTAPSDPAARGAGTFAVDPSGRVDFVIATKSPVITDITAAGVHIGNEGQNGIALQDLDVGSAVVDASLGTLSGSVTPPLATLSRICADVRGFYLNLVTASAPIGIARGQLCDDDPQFWTCMEGDQETTIVDANARGGCTLQFPSFTAGIAHLAVPDAQGIDLVNQAHVHEAPAGAEGPVVIDLQAGADYNVSVPTGSADGSITCEQTLLTRMLACPGAFYANFHTATAPAGLVRGQLTQTPVTFFAAMLDENEVPPIIGPDNGTITVIFTGVFTASFNLTMGAPPATDITAGHIHDSPAGVNGPVLVDFSSQIVANASGNTSDGTVTLTGRTFARMLADASDFYANMHTAANPGGHVRGQFAKVQGDIPPAGLTYDTPVCYQESVAIDNNVPASTGGAITNYAVSPTLPAGLLLNPVSGVISGTPTAPTAAADYTVTGSNDAGSTQATVNIKVDATAPANLAYTTPVTYVQNSAITNNVPTNTGGTITNYTVSPALPTGLSLSATTGVISGTPTVTQSATNHVVTGTNSGGSTMATVNITVTSALQPPSNLSYSSPVSYPTGCAITDNSPTISGGAVDTYAVSPALPAGLTLNGTTGVISGTPTSVTSQTNYTVTATNAAGSTQATVTITTPLGAPKNLSYSNTPNVGYVTGGIFATMNPTVSGGTVASYSITPALPAGVTLNTTTGVISGTPTTQTNQTNHTVTATNASGSTTAQITITILQ